MRFLPRNRSAGNLPAPAWAGRLSADDVQALIGLLRLTLGPLAPSIALFYGSADVAARLRLRELVLTVEGRRRADWPGLVRHHIRSGDAMRNAGDRMEASSQEYAKARPLLRLVPMPAGSAPRGDLAIPSLVADIVEVLAIDTGPSIRFVSERLAARWDQPIPTLVADADEQIRRMILERSDRAAFGRPEVRAAFSTEPHGASFVRQLEHFVPGVGGILGTVVALPTPNHVFFRDLDPGSDLRGDLVDLAVLASKTHGDAKAPVLGLPLWRRPDGTCRVVKFRFSEKGDLLGSWDPAFDGVLTALDPLDRLVVPAWAADLGAAAYTLFAGLVAAAADVWAEEVAILGGALRLDELVGRCQAVDDERWPGMIAEHLEETRSPALIAHALLEDPRPAIERVRARLVATLSPLDAVVEDAERRPTSLPGLVECLGLRVMDEVVPVPGARIESLGPLDELYVEAERQTGETVRSIHLAGGLAPRTYAIRGPGASVALLRFAEWAPKLAGPGGVIVASSDDRWATIASVDDALALIEVPGLLGWTPALDGPQSTRLPPTLVWEAPAGRVIAQLDRDEDGVVRGARVTGPVRDLARAVPLPEEPPLGLDEILQKRWRPFLRALIDELVDRIADNLAQLVELRGPNIREFAAGCAGLKEVAWPAYLAACLDEIALRRVRLDFLSTRSTYEEARESLIVRVASEGGGVSRRLPGGLRASLFLSNPPRHRPLVRGTIERWGVDEATCWTDAEANLVGLADLVEEPMPGGHPSWQVLYSPSTEAEAAALYLHRRHPGARNGFVVSITHGSRAHFVRLDDRGAAATVGAFGQHIGEIFRLAREAHDERSSVLYWLMPDGSLTELYDALEPFPGLERLPAAFATIVRRDLAPPFG